MQEVNFGTVEGLAIQGGEPVFNPRPRIMREVKFGGQNGPRPEVGKHDFALKGEVLELFAQIEAMRDGVIRSIEVRYGLPFKMTIEDDAA